LKKKENKITHRTG